MVCELNKKRQQLEHTRDNRPGKRARIELTISFTDPSKMGPPVNIYPSRKYTSQKRKHEGSDDYEECTTINRLTKSRSIQNNNSKHNSNSKEETITRPKKSR